MGEHAAFVLAMFFKTVMIVSAIAGTVFLAYNDRPGWGWLIFITFILAGTSIHVGDDTKKEEPAETVTKQN